MGAHCPAAARQAATQSVSRTDLATHTQGAHSARADCPTHRIVVLQARHTLMAHLAEGRLAACRQLGRWVQGVRGVHR